MKNLVYFLIILGTISCSSEEELIRGCTDPDSNNYNTNATEDDGSCTYLRDIFLGNYDGVFGNCLPENNLNNFSDPKTIVIQPGEKNDEVKVIVNDISVEGFRDKKVMTFIAEVTEDELIFRRSESSDRFVIGDISIRVYLDGTMGRSSNGDLSGRIIIDAFDTGAANTSLNLYNCDFTFTKK